MPRGDAKIGRKADDRERELSNEFYMREDERRRESYKGYEENMPDADKARERGSMQHLDDAEAFSTTATKPTAFNFP